MGSFKTATDKMVTWFSGHSQINNVTFGDINEIDVTTITDFPLAHVIPLQSTGDSNISKYSYQIMILDKYETINDTDSLLKDSKVQVLDDLNTILEDFKLAFTGDGTFVLKHSASQIMYDLKINRLYGWVIAVEVTLPSEGNCS